MLRPWLEVNPWAFACGWFPAHPMGIHRISIANVAASSRRGQDVDRSCNSMAGNLTMLAVWADGLEDQVEQPALIVTREF